MARSVRCRACGRIVQRRADQPLIACQSCGGIVSVVDAKVDRRMEKAKRELDELKER